jgi:hypothetical protein
MLGTPVSGTSFEYTFSDQDGSSEVRKLSCNRSIVIIYEYYGCTPPIAIQPSCNWPLSDHCYLDSEFCA